MTAGNVNTATDMAAITSISMAGSNVSPVTANNTNFRDFLAKPISTVNTSVNTSKDSPVKTPEYNLKSNTRDITTNNTSEPKLSTDDVKNVTEDIKETVKETLGLTDEELETKLEELGITTIDLLVPTNLVNFIASVNNTDNTAIITNSNLSEQFTDILNQFTEIVNELSDTLNVPSEEIITALNNFNSQTENFSDVLESATQNDSAKNEYNSEIPDNDINPEAQKVTTETVVTDSETGKSIKITLEGKEIKTEQVQMTKPQETTAKQDTKDGFTQNQEEKSTDKNSFAGEMIKNLADSVQNTQSVSESFTQSYSSVTGMDIVNQLIDAVRVSSVDDIKSMEIQLTPENLGKINLTVAAKDGVITATIVTQNEAVKDALANQITQLKENMNNQGLKVQDVEVTVANQGFNTGTDNGGREREQQGNRTSRRFRGINDINMDDETVDSTEDAVQKVNGNSVSFTA